MYYVYEFYNVDTNEVLYAGKGTNNRYKVRYGRNDLLTKAFEQYNCDSRIIKYFETEKEAFKYEYEYIKEMKEKGQCKCNIYSGGAGGSSEYWTEELRHEYSVNNIMKRPEQRQRMSENNPMKNKEIAEKVNSQKRRPVIINDIRYESIQAVKDAYNTDYDIIVSWCNKGINYKGELCRFEDSPQVIFSDKRYNKGGCKSVMYMGQQFESAKDCAEAFNVSENVMYSYLKRGFDLKGNKCRYLDDDRELTFVNPFQGKKGKPVLINGIRYNSVSEASQILQIPKSTLYSYLQGKRKNPNYICIYDNQQPSQENVE